MKEKSGVDTYFEPDSFVRPRDHGDPGPTSSSDLGGQGKCRAAGDRDEEGETRRILLGIKIR